LLVVVVLGCSLADASTTFRCLDGDSPIDVEWDVNENVICFTVTANCNGCWAGIAFNSPNIKTDNPMYGADFYIATYTSAGEFIIVDDMFVASNASSKFPGVDTSYSSDCQYNAFVPPAAATQVNGVSSFSFCRLFDTGDATCDFPLSGHVGVLCAHGTSNTLGYHKSYRQYTPSYVFEFDSDSTGVDTDIPTPPEKSPHYIVWHAGFMFLAFGILMPWGAFVSRYMKSYWWWFPLHIVTQMLAIILSVVAFIIIILTIDPSTSFTFIHAYIGLAALIAAWLSPILGLMSHVMWDPDRKKVPVFPDMVHWYIARLAILLGFTAIFLGILRLGIDTLAYVFAVLVVFYFVALLAIEVAQRFNKNSYETIN